MPDRKYDLTSGSILKKLLLVAIPIMGLQLMQMAYNLVDIFYLGRVGSDAVAASGTAGMYMWMASGLMLLGRIGVEIGVAQSLGSRDIDEAKRYARGAFHVAIVLGLIFAAIMILFRRPLVGFFKLKESNVVLDAERYLAIVGVAVPFTFVSAVTNGIFTASGNSRMPFVANAAGLALNIALDPVLIFGAKMGVVGAAIATASAQILVTVIVFTALKRHKRRPFETIHILRRSSFPHIKRMLRWSLPVALESLLFTFLSMLTNKIVAGYGAGPFSAVQVGSQIESLSWLIGGGYGSAVMAFVGQNYGAGRQDRIDRCVRLSVNVMAVWGAIVSLVLFFAGGVLFKILLNDESLLPVGIAYLRILSVGEIALCIEGVGSAAFRGCGQTHQSAIASITANILRVVMAYALSTTPLGINGVFIAVALSTTLRGTWIVGWYYKTRHRFSCAQRVPVETVNSI